METHREEDHVMTEIEGGVAQPQAKELQGLPATTGRQERGTEQCLFTPLLGAFQA